MDRMDYLCKLAREYYGVKPYEESEDYDPDCSDDFLINTKINELEKLENYFKDELEEWDNKYDEDGNSWDEYEESPNYSKPYSSIYECPGYDYYSHGLGNY